MKNLNILYNKTVNYKSSEDQTIDVICDAVYAGYEKCGIMLTSSLLNEGKAPEDSTTMSFFIRDGGDIFIYHSLADRNYYAQKGDDGPIVDGFDLVFVPGKWTKNRILQHESAALNRFQVVSAGHPRIDHLRAVQRARPSPPPLQGGGRRILYVPGHANHGNDKAVPVSSGRDFFPLLDRLGDRNSVTAYPHPRDRRKNVESKEAVCEELVDCDVVITDVSSVMFEAWALGKPVIFPRWILGDSVVERYPGSAEAHIHARRIGYHPDSLEELCTMIDDGPVIGEDVHEFMRGYLATYEGGNSGDIILGALTTHFADEDPAASAEIERIVANVLSSLPTMNPVNMIDGTVRTIIQLSQQYLLNTDHETLVNIVSGVHSASNVSTQMSKDLFSLEAESALHRCDLTHFENVRSRLAKLDAGVAKYFEAVLDLRQGRTREAIEKTLEAVGSGVRSYAAWRLLAFGLHQLGRTSDALSFLSRLSRHYMAEELIEDAMSLVTSHNHHGQFVAIARRARKLLGPLNFEKLRLEAEIAAGVDETTIDLAREVSKAMVRSMPTDPAGGTIAGYGPKLDLPVILIPYERLSAQAIVTPSPRRVVMLETLCRILSASDIPFFLSRQTLQAFLHDENLDLLPEVIELGISSASDVNAVCLELQHLALLEPVPALSNEDRKVMRGPNGLRLVIMVHHPDGEGGYTVRDGGVITSVPGFEIVRHGVGVLTAPIPSDAAIYLDAVFGNPDPECTALAPLLSGTDHEIVDQTALELRCHADLIAALMAGNDALAALLARTIRRLGGPMLAIDLAKMHDNYFLETFPEHLEAAHFILHVGEGADAGFHVDLWYDYIRDVDPSCLLVIRSMQLFKLLRTTRPELNAVYVKSGIEAEWVVGSCPNLCAVLYVSNTGNTVHFLRFNHLRHVWLGHGDSEKAASCHKFFRAYDEIWCAGMAQIDRFVNSGMNHDSLHFRIVGRPTLRTLIERDDEPAAGRRFLYLPTWEGFQNEQGYSSIGEALKLVPMVARMTGVECLVKFHPWSGKRLKSYAVVEEKLANMSLDGPSSLTVLPRTQPVVEIMTGTDFLVSDVSSVVSDYLAVGKPIFLYMPGGHQLRMTTSAVGFDRYCYIFHDATELDALVRQVVLEGDDYLAVSRQRAREHLVDTDRTMNHSFEQSLHDLVKEHDMTTHAWSSETPSTDRTAPVPVSHIIAHRGDRENHPENSLSGYAATVAMPGLDGVEIDVHRTKDGELVVMHDPTLDRTTTGTGPIFDSTLQEIRALSLKTKVRGEVVEHDEIVPTLDEVLDVLAQGDLTVYVEIKNDALGNAYADIARPVLEAIDKHGLRERTVLTSFSPDVLEVVRHVDRDIPLLASVNYRSVEMLGGVERTFGIFDRIEGCAITVEHTFVAKLRAAMPDDFDFRRFGVWVVNDPQRLEAALRAGHRQIFTDKPGTAIGIRDAILMEGDGVTTNGS